jgi:hypothetical protein
LPSRSLGEDWSPADPSNGKRERLPYKSVIRGQLNVLGYLLSGEPSNSPELPLFTNQLEHFLVARMVAQRIEIGVVLDPGFSLVIRVW